MAIPNKAYILRIHNTISYMYSKTCSESCDKVGLPWEFHDGYQNMTGKAAWGLTGIKVGFHEPVRHIPVPTPAQKANATSAGHAAIWKKIAEGSDECVIILEHDAIMLQPMNIDVPDYVIAVLGYKVPDPEKYDAEKAGPPQQLVDINGHEGAHAYAITKKTAQYLIKEIEENGVLGAVDNAYFIRGQRRTKIPLKLADPTPALGWIRESTIWNSSAHRNYEFVTSFKENYK